MFAANAVLLFGIFGLLFANQASSSCVTEENHSKGMKETSCVQLALTSVPVTDIPQDTGILILSFNNLTAISTSTFKGMKQLVELDLSDNSLTSFKVDLPIMLTELILANNSFETIPDLSQLSSLTRLDLSNNHISIIPDSAFKGLKSLKVLKLQRNAIDSLSEKVFNELEKLDLLDLSYNWLSELPTYLISSLAELQKFYLTKNKLKNIPDDFFMGLDNLSYVYLDQNPWICDCALHYLKDWVEENAHSIYYLNEGTPLSDEYSVRCFDGTALLNSTTIVCAGNGAGDLDPDMPTPTNYMPTPQRVTQEQPTTGKTTEPWITTMKATTVHFAKTTPVLATTKHPTSAAPTMKIKALTTPIVTSTKQPETTTTPQVAWTTRTITTTPFKTTRTTTEQRRTTSQTTKVTTSIIYPSTTLHPTSILTTTVKVEPSTLLTTSVVPTQKHLVTVSNEPTSVKVTETSLTSTEIQLYTMPPAIESLAKAHGMSWLEYTILKNCCFLHLILYIVGLLLLLAQMILSAWLLIWTHTHLYRHYRALMEKSPNIRLIRYSLRAPVSEGAILLVHDKTVEANFSEHSSFGVTKMLVLEANSRNQEQIYTSAIL